MIPLTPRQKINALVGQHCRVTGMRGWETWDLLYTEFEKVTNWNVRKEANNTDHSPLGLICGQQRDGEMLAIAERILKKPALPEAEKEKAPVQRDLYQD